MFDVELPDFFVNDAISDFFTDDLNGFIEMKSSSYFNSSSFNEFVELAEEMEDNIIGFVNSQKQKVELFNNTKNKFEGNNDILRDLNAQVAAFKVGTEGFGYANSKEKEKTDVKNEFSNRMNGIGGN